MLDKKTINGNDNVLIGGDFHYTLDYSVNLFAAVGLSAASRPARSYRLAELLKAAEPTAGSNFFELGEPRWSDILRDLDIPRRIAPALLQRILTPESDCEVVPVVGRSSSGKSTLLRRLCVELHKLGRPVYFFDCKAGSLQPHEVLAAIAGDAANETDRVFVACDNANMQLLQAALSLQDYTSAANGITIVSTHQFSDISIDIGLNSEIVKGSDGRSMFFAVESLDASEREHLKRKLISLDYQLNPDPSGTVGESTFLDVLQSLLPQTRLLERASSLLRQAAPYPAVDLLLRATALTYSIGVPLPATMAASFIDGRTGKEWHGHITQAQLDQFYLIAEQDSFRLTHESLGRAICGNLSPIEQSQLWIELLRASACDSASGEVFIARMLRSISSEPESTAAWANVFRSDSSFRELLRLVECSESLRVRTLAMCFLVLNDRQPSLAANAAAGHKDPIGQLVFHDLCVTLQKESEERVHQKCCAILGLSALPPKQDQAPAIAATFESAIFRIFLSPRAPGLDTILMCLSKFRSFAIHDSLIAAISTQEVKQERLANYLIEHNLSKGNKAQLTTLCRGKNFKAFTYGRLFVNLHRAALLVGDLPLKLRELRPTLQWQIDFERVVMAGGGGIQKLHFPNPGLGPVWEWMYCAAGGSLNRPSNYPQLRTALNRLRNKPAASKADMRDLASLIVLLKYFPDYVSEMDFVHAVKLALQLADFANYPAGEFWAFRQVAFERALQFARRLNANEQIGLFRFTDHIFQCTEVFDAAQLRELANCAALRESRSGANHYFHARRCALNNELMEASRHWNILLGRATVPHTALSRYANFLAYQTRDLDQAISTYSTIVSGATMDPASMSRYLNNLGMVYILRFNDHHEAGDFWNARACFESAAKALPTNVWPKRNLATFAYLGDGTDVRRELRDGKREVVLKRTHLGIRRVTKERCLRPHTERPPAASI